MIKKYKYTKTFILLWFWTLIVQADSFDTNSYNNHGVVGLINMPTARFFDETSHGLTGYDGNPDQKITLTSSPYDWLEASFFYTSIKGKEYPGYEYQNYKDKGFNFKLRLKKEGALPAIAIGINDIAGTGLYSSEYVVGSYGVGRADFHFGLGWGSLNGAENKINNPLGYLNNSFKIRNTNVAAMGGAFQPSKYFSSIKTSPFYGLSYSINNKTILKIEKDVTLTSEGEIPYMVPKYEYSYGIDYSFNNNFVFGLSYERGNSLSLRLVYKNNPKKYIQNYKYKKPKINNEDNKYTKLIKNLEENGIGVNRIKETTGSLGLELTQFIHPNMQIVEKIIKQASINSGIKKNVVTDFSIADLNAVSEIDSEFNKSAKLIYERKQSRKFNSSTQLRFKPFIASREEFFKGALLLENNSEFIFKENLFFNLNLKYSLADNFDDLRFPPLTSFPAQVRSDVKQYLKTMDQGVLLGRAQLDYHLTPRKNHHLMFSGGVLEDMFNGYGVEYLYFKQKTNYAIGFELFNVKKRDYNWGFGTLDYENLTGSINLYIRNYGYIPFDLKVSHGEYLAGDFGTTFEISRSYSNGMKFGVFASNTDVSSDDFGEGSFDKGVFFDIPVYGNFINYSWRPLTKDPAAKLNRMNNLYNLLVKFRPIND
tara:strand:+ start:2586 stop:4538 length:1953 start_codon:yes stop_codon:yes gene_type:complete